MKPVHLKKRKVSIPDTITNYQYDLLCKKLDDMKSAVEYELTDELLYIEYNLKQVSFDDIWTMVKSVLLKNQYQSITWWKYNLLAQLETNEKDHLASRFGWYEYLTDIYVAHHIHFRDDTNRKKLWQQYSKSDKTKET